MNLHSLFKIVYAEKKKTRMLETELLAADERPKSMVSLGLVYSFTWLSSNP